MFRSIRAAGGGLRLRCGRACCGRLGGGDQANVLEDAEVFGDARLFEAERGDDVAHGALLRGQEGEDSATTRFCDSVEGVGGGGSARHGNNIYPYRNMSRDFLRRI